MACRLIFSPDEDDVIESNVGIVNGSLVPFFDNGRKDDNSQATDNLLHNSDTEAPVPLSQASQHAPPPSSYVSTLVSLSKL